MKRFTNLYLALDATSRTNDKVDHLVRYFQAAPPADAAWALALMTGRRPGGVASSPLLRRLAAERAEQPDWIIAECHAAVGDFSETIALLVPGPSIGSDEPLHETLENRVLPLLNASESARRTIIESAWDAFDADQRFVFHKLIRGGFRVGVQKRLVVRALAERFGVEPLVMAHRMSGAFEPTADAFLRLGSDDGGVDLSRPYPFYLAHQIAGPPQDLGDPRDWVAELKWDGIRAQLIRRGGRIFLWSRGEEPIEHQFPEITHAAGALPDGVALDGEILAWRNDRPRSFAALQERLNRKAPPIAQPGLFESPETVVFMVYDLLEAWGDDLRALPLTERRARLEDILPSSHPTLRLSPLLHSASWEDLERQRVSARGMGAEGLMLKNRNGAYGIGRTKDPAGTGWWKWKLDPLTVDAILIYAQPGSGRRAGLYTDYTFAVRDPEAGNDALTPFAKAYSGLTQTEIEQLDAWVRAHTLKKMGPVRQVEPLLVFEIAFEAIQSSTRHASGIAVRFPRILRWRHDKTAQEADTIQSLRDLLKALEP